ncbi:MAG: TonB-dependent receptor [Lewinellaceae bacterium]|nr:TonB-dependent receptor [Phaeodactylibacter sp.]MCB9035800.1 TonB-dependent receptor [Lewinellaceae bacterium]
MNKFLLTLLASLLLSTAAGAQGVVKGQIFDENGLPLAGANVLIAETKQGGATDENGTYRIANVKPGDYTLKITYVGYETASRKAVVANGQNLLELDVSLESRTIQVDELIVRATRAGEKAPMTYTNLDAEEIQKGNLGQDVPFLLRWTPSAVVTSDAGTGVGYTGIRIRGTDPTRINVTINGIPLNDAESQGVFWVDLPDFASSAADIQIQRGVGSSTNGAGAFGASINLNTAQLRTQPYAEINGTVGSFNTLKGNLQFGTGLLKGKFAIDGRLSRITSDGYIDRATADLQSYYLSGAFMGEKSSLRFITFSGHEVTYQAWYGVPPQYLDDEDLRTFNPAGMEKEGEPYSDEVDDYRQTHYQLLYNNQLHPNWNLNLALHYTLGQGFFEQYKADQALADYGLENISMGGEVVSTTDLVRRLWLDNDFYGAVYGLNYRAPSGKLDATLGGGYHIYEGLHFGEVAWAEFASNSEKDERYYENDARKSDFNIFAKFNYQLLPRLNAYLDLQYRRVGYDFLGFNREAENVEQSVGLDFFNPKAGFYYELGPRSHAYASFAVANREPNRNDYVESTIDSRPQPETLYNTEVGYQHNWDKAALGLNLYQMYYRDQLALNGEVNDVGAYTRINIDKSYRLGVELTGGLQLLDGLRLDGNATLSRNKVETFTEFVDVYDADFNWLGQEGVGHENTDLSFSPDVIAGAGLTYEIFRRDSRHDAAFSLLSKYVSRQYIDNTSDRGNSIDPYAFSDLRIRCVFRPGFAREIALTLLARNIFDAQFETNAWSYRYIYDGSTALDQGYFPQAGRNFLMGVTVGF